ncbi:hypothetical protein SORBI_3004G180600 [Sorghum bicolor]|uniref:COX assembly mitochondrial protein n=1 Tax=Sorghum bicolor TaxID=4558 RepID=A0A194YQD0_SORBI|nr:hypothetical protein SORBI_3004G180600 [Sorghum bicolor]
MHPPLTLHRHPMCAEVICCFCFDFILVFLNILFIYMLLHYFSKTYNDNIFVQIIEEFQKCHLDHPVKKFFGECTDLKIKLDRCFRQEKALKRKANFEESKKFKEQLQAYKREIAEKNEE